MELKFSGKNGISIEIITKKIKTELEKYKLLNENKKEIKSYKKGYLNTQDWKKIYFGLETLTKIITKNFNIKGNEILLGDKDISRVEKELFSYRQVIDDFIMRITIGTRNEYEIRKRIDSLKDYSQIAQAARDGIIIKQETRREEINGESKDTIYDTSMTPREIMNILRDYNRQVDRLQYERLNSYLGLGLGLAGVLGTVTKGKSTEVSTKKARNLIGLGNTAMAGLKLIQGILKEDNREEEWKLKSKQYRIMDDLLVNEQISGKAEEDLIEEIRNLAREEIKLSNEFENKRFIFDVITDLAIAIISGMYINKNIQIKDNGKIDGKSLASAIALLQTGKGIAGNFISAAKEIQNSKKDEQEFEKTCKKVKEIFLQMEEKVYPLKGATNPFESLEIVNFNGKFYPKKNYETGKTEFTTKINIPEFSMKRGDVILLSGESGAGKSTFLRLLKRGDINNRNCITLNNGEKVDNLGKEYISFRPSINLGDETNILFQITGKANISDLDENEKESLTKILKELKLDFPNLLEQLASRKFMEFSTGQQRRFALSKLFYRINDGTSVIIVDEPVGNVEDKLIREQLEMIVKYAKEKDVMLLLTTHRLDLANDLATKRYNINKNGVLEQINLKQERIEEKKVTVEDMEENYNKVTTKETQRGIIQIKKLCAPIKETTKDDEQEIK